MCRVVWIFTSLSKYKDTFAQVSGLHGGQVYVQAVFQQEVMHEETVALPEDVRNANYEIGRPGCSWGQSGSRKENLGL